MSNFKRRPTRPSLSLLLAGLVVSTGLLMIPTLTRALPSGTDGSPPPHTSATPRITPMEPSIATPPPPVQYSHAPIVTPTPPAVVDAYDYTQPVAQSEAVDMAYFSDALFIGDSRTDGLQLFSGIKDTTFFCYKGITVFDVMEDTPKKVIELDGTKYSIQGALELKKGQFEKVYLSLGINELGYFDDQGFYDKFAALIDLVRATQPSASIYLQNLIPVNPELCAKNWSPYVNNQKIADYNAIFTRLSQDKQVFLLDVATALSNSDGILALENTVDGVHFTKTWYKEWLSYLMCHTVENQYRYIDTTAPI